MHAFLALLAGLVALLLVRTCQLPFDGHRTAIVYQALIAAVLIARLVVECGPSLAAIGLTFIWCAALTPQLLT